MMYESMKQIKMHPTVDEYVTDETCDRVLRSMLESYHKPSPVVINHNRNWVSCFAMLKRLDPNFKCIMLVRDLAWIVDSFEVLYHSNPYSLPSYYDENANTTVYGRFNGVMNKIVGPAYDMVKSAIHSPYKDNILFVEYDDLVNKPEETLRAIYDYLEEPYFEHDFTNIVGNYQSYDTKTGTPNLHTIRTTLSPNRRQTVLPPDIWNQLQHKEIWREENLNLRTTRVR